MALHESVAFVLAQMTIEGQRAAESDVQLKTDLAKQRHENGRLTMQVAQADHATMDGWGVLTSFAVAWYLFFFVNRRVYSSAQTVGGFTLSELPG